MFSFINYYMICFKLPQVGCQKMFVYDIHIEDKSNLLSLDKYRNQLLFSYISAYSYIPPFCIAREICNIANE